MSSKAGNKFRLKNQLSLINEEEDEELNVTQRTWKFETSPDMKHQSIQQHKNISTSTGLDKFMMFLDKSESSSVKKLKPLPISKKTSEKDQLNPENNTRQRPKSSTERNALNKFTEFLKSQDQGLEEKVMKKKKRHADGLSKFMETLSIGEMVKQEKKLGNIVSGILAMSQNLPQLSINQQRHRYLINQDKFAQIGQKIKLRCHSASTNQRKNQQQIIKATDKKELQQQKPPIITKGQLLKKVITRNLPKSKQITQKALQRKIRFFQNINDGKSLKLKMAQTISTNNKQFAFIN